MIIYSKVLELANARFRVPRHLILSHPFHNTTHNIPSPLTTSIMASKFYAIVAGVGAGTGRSVALRFAQSYPVVLLARNPSNYTDIVAEIKSSGGHAIGISTDTSDPASVSAAFEEIKKELPEKNLAAAICAVPPPFPPIYFT